MTDPNLEPDLEKLAAQEDPRRRKMTRARATKLAAVMGKTVEEVMVADRIQRANWDAVPDPEELMAPEDVEAIAAASPEFDRG